MLAFYRNLAKLTRNTSKLIGKKGTDLPGKVLRKLDKDILIKLSKQYDEIVFVTGTMVNNYIKFNWSYFKRGRY